MNKFVVTQLSILTLVGCASSGTYVNSSLLAPGMTKQEVISVLGKLPDKKEARGKKERYDYANVEICFDENGKLYEASAICSI
ncbi:hypothetical protein EXH44_05655 [Actinobacillus indolicus]|uniref:Outer membrane protein assembly factor BamE n=1 Tax=Actinobacillus indolicus TaxID=51049 RepID=A0A4P7CID3_9PAST|nr:outer membrane protein assembly factor BamE [Actinobacillus indolicus]QBQ63754.1 hypothetical protein EXH44_05655 [Actinobacillus indolicus]